MKRLLALAVMATVLASQSVMAQNFSIYAGGHHGGFGVSTNSGWNHQHRYGGYYSNNYPSYNHHHQGFTQNHGGWGGGHYPQRNSWGGSYGHGHAHGGHHGGYYQPSSYYRPRYSHGHW